MKCLVSCTVLAFIGIASVNYAYLYELPQGSALRYFYLSFSDLFNILVLSSVVYYFVEYKNDKRTRKAFVEGIANRIISYASDEKMFKVVCKEDIKHIRITQRMISNELDILEKFADEFSFCSELEYCKEQIKIYWDIISDNINDINSLMLLESSLQNHLANVVNKVELITSKLHR